MTDLDLWEKKAREYSWTMPSAPRWKRLPIVRHIRTYWNMIQVERWYANGPGYIGLRTGYDEWALFGMWHGRERDDS